MGQNSHANLIINGDFEHNAATVTEWNMTNATFNETVASATAFGGTSDIPEGEIDLVNGASEFGEPPQSGDWKLGIASEGDGLADAFSFDLSAAIVSGNTYNLGFFAHAIVENFSPEIGEVEIGLSNNSIDFGTLVLSGVPDASDWTMLGGTFVAPLNATFLTVRQGNRNSWNHVDSFSLVLVPEPSGLGNLMTIALALFTVSSTRRRRRRS
jgi:hypothetical protein